MSTRALRKLHGGGQDLAQIGVLNESDEDIQPVANKRGKKKKKGTEQLNPFDLLDAEEHEGEGDSKGASESPEDDEPHKENTENSTDKAISTECTRKKKTKKKKKKNRQQESKTENNPSEDEIEASIRQVNEILGEVTTLSPLMNDTQAIDNRIYKALLSIEHKNLNPDNEMRRIFGSRVVQTDQSRNQGNHGNRRHRNPAARRNAYLVQARDTWPHLGKTGLSMELKQTPNCQQFVFLHNKEYQKIQFQFLEAVESIDPQNIINMANMYPHHIDTLLQVSEICRMSEDMQMATEFIERALFVFESSFHPLFNLTQATARLEYKHQENRAFYIALFRHLHYVGKRGCYRTSMEFCKLILSLDPDGDPLCVLLMIDFYALHAEQYSFLIQLYNEWETQRNLSQLPNFAMSVPLAMFHQAEQDNRDTSAADLMLQNSLLMFPALLPELLDKCSIVPDGRVSSHSFFGTKAQLGQPKALEQLIALYVGRSSSCWKNPDVVAWLERNVSEVLNRVDQNDPLVTDYANKRQARYQGTPRNIHRHIMMAEIREATAALPPDMAHTPVMSYDPLPPADSVAAYTRPTRPNRAQSNSNALSMFFQSLMPNFNPQEVAEEPGAAGGEGQNFRAGVTQVMEAMRELLNNIQPVPAPVENGHNQDPDDPDDPDPEWD